MRILTALLALSLSLPALADHPGPAPRYEPLGVERLELRGHPRHGLQLEYAFHKRDLRQARRAGVNPVLRVEIDGRVERYALDHRRGALHLPSGRGMPSRVHVDVVDRSRRRANRVVPLSLGGVLVDGLDLRVPRRYDDAPVATPPATPPPPRAPDWAYDQATQRACHNAFWRGEGREACLQAVRTSAVSPASAVQACDRAFTNAGATLRCVQAVGRANRDLGADIAACDRALVNEGNTAACVEVAAQRVASIDALAQSCDRAFVQDGRVQRCIESAAFSRVSDEQAVQAIRSCDDYYAGDHDALMCVERALPGRVAAR